MKNGHQYLTSIEVTVCQQLALRPSTRHATPVQARRTGKVRGAGVQYTFTNSTVHWCIARAHLHMIYVNAVKGRGAWRGFEAEGVRWWLAWREIVQYSHVQGEIMIGWTKGDRPGAGARGSVLWQKMSGMTTCLEDKERSRIKMRLKVIGLAKQGRRERRGGD